MKRILTEEQKLAKKRANDVWRAKNSELIKSKSKEYREKNKEKISLNNKRSREKNKEKHSILNKKWHEENKEYIKEKRKAERLSRTLEEIALDKEKKKIYDLNHKQESLKRQRKRAFLKKDEINENLRNRRSKDPAFRMLDIARSRERQIYTTFKKGKIGHNGFQKRFGCDGAAWKSHIESQFKPGMAWENWGKVWEIDHVLPLILCDSREDKLLKLSHYTNLRPCEISENRSKNDKIYPHLINPAFPYYEDFKEQIMEKLKTQTRAIISENNQCSNT